MKAYNKIITLLIILIIFLSTTAFSQTKRAHHWFFSVDCWLDFNSGSPPTAKPRIQHVTSYTVSLCGASNLTGELQFSASCSQVFNKAFWLMGNGDNIGNHVLYQGPLVFNKPGSERFYYIFNFGILNFYTDEFVYSMIDLEANGGFGTVMENYKKVPLRSGIVRNVHGIHHSNGLDVWVVNHGLNSNKWYSYRVTPDGVQPPIISEAGDPERSSDTYIKISPDGKHIVHTVSEPVPPPWYVGSFQDRIEVLKFDNTYGTISDSEKLVIKIESLYNNDSKVGFEFSPDGSKLYVTTYHRLYQYDLAAGDSAAIINSRYRYDLDTMPGQYHMGSMQLGPDGKVYINAGTGGAHPSGEMHLSVIHNPNESGAASNFIQNSFYMNGIRSGAIYALPSFLADYFKDPVIKTEKHCAEQPVSFSLELLEPIDSVYWKFNDFFNIPNDTSTLLSPQYTFSKPGDYNVTATIYFGNLQRTVKKKVEIKPIPKPDLGGPDTLMCAGSTLLLDAGEGYVLYSWNGSLPTGQTYEVEQPGEYYVKVKNEYNCFGTDTINVAFSTEPTIIVEPEINHTACDNSDGYITGIVLAGEEPFDYYWTNIQGDTISHDLNLIGISAGIYTLSVVDRIGCSTIINHYQILNNSGAEIEDVHPIDAKCGNNQGQIIIVPLGGHQPGYLYSLDGVDFYDNGGHFNQLSPDTYYPMLKDQANCINTWPESITITDTQPPLITDIIIKPESEAGADGEIIVFAQGNELIFMLLTINQLGPHFTGLTQGQYHLLITDLFGCQTDTIIYIPGVNGYILNAYADGDAKCLNRVAISPLYLTNGIGLTELKATVRYNGEIINCIGFDNKLNGLNATVYPLESIIVLEWNSLTPIATSDTIVLIELVFNTSQFGDSDIEWQNDESSTWFKSQTGEALQAELESGKIIVNNPPGLTIEGSTNICSGSDLDIKTVIINGTAHEFNWSTPTLSQTGANLFITNVTPSHSGKYTVTAIDQNNCIGSFEFDVNIFNQPSTGLEFIGDTVYFYTNTIITATPGYSSYLWSNGETTHSITVAEEGPYSVTVRTAEGCESTDTVYAKDGSITFDVPDAFTPDNDGLNDLFRCIFKAEFVKQYNLSIYSRWGAKIFETNNHNEGWSGNGMPAGVYVWKISFTDYSNRVHKASGFVTLIR